MSRSGAIETSIAHLPGPLLDSALARDERGRYGVELLVASGAAGKAAGEPAAEPPGEAGGDRRRYGDAGDLRSLFFLEPGNPSCRGRPTRSPPWPRPAAAPIR